MLGLVYTIKDSDSQGSKCLLGLSSLPRKKPFKGRAGESRARAKSKSYVSGPQKNNKTRKKTNDNFSLNSLEQKLRVDGIPIVSGFPVIGHSAGGRC